MSKISKIYYNFLNFLDTLKAVLFDMIDEMRVIGEIKFTLTNNLEAIKRSLEKNDIMELKNALDKLVEIARNYWEMMNPTDKDELPSFPINNNKEIRKAIDSIDEILSSDYAERFRNTIEAFAEELEIELEESY